MYLCVFFGLHVIPLLKVGLDSACRENIIQKESYCTIICKTLFINLISKYISKEVVAFRYLQKINSIFCKEHSTSANNFSINNWFLINKVNKTQRRISLLISQKLFFMNKMWKKNMNKSQICLHIIAMQRWQWII